MDRNHGFAAVLFADLVGSTQLYEKLGDRQAQSIIGSCLSRLTEATCAFNGEVVKTIGDEVMSVFADADQAVLSAVRMHQSIEALSKGDNLDQVSLCLHVGVHAGPIVRRSDDVFGDTVNVAARITKLANPRQILTTGDTVAHLGAQYRSSARLIGAQSLKGKSGAIQIYEYVWDKSDLTVRLDRLTSALAGLSQLEIRFGNCSIRLNQDNPGCTIGRNAGNDIVLKFERISRFHAKIEYRRHKFILTDHSSNGTYVDFIDGDDVYIKRDEIRLIGTGLISPGRKATAGSPGAIHFCVSA